MVSPADLSALREAARSACRGLLLVDDDPSVHQLVLATLGPGFVLARAFDGLVGLEMAQRASPSVIILDYVMPGLHGEEFCRRVRADPALRDVRILLLTGWLDGFLAARAQQMGADDSLAKPFSPTALLTKIAALATSLAPTAS